MRLTSIGGYKKRSIISGYPALKQSDYGGLNDCTITSITALYCFKNKDNDPAEVYEKVNAIAGVDTDKCGVMPWRNKGIIDKLFGVKSKCKYLKGIGYNWDTIVAQIDKQNPLTLSMWNDGRDCYKNHTVSVVGYAIGHSANYLAVYDNWQKNIAYIDYDKLSIISCINYLP